MGPTKKDDTLGAVGGIAHQVTDGLVEQYQDSKDVLEYLQETMFTELKEAAAGAEKDRQRRKRHQQLQQQKSAVNKDATATTTTGAVRDELEKRSSGGLWVSPETGKPGSGTPRSLPLGGGKGGATSPRSRSSGGGGRDESPRSGRGDDKNKKKKQTESSTAAAQAAGLWSTKVAPVVGPAVTSVRAAMARGPAYDYDGHEDTAAAPLANWPGRDADPKGWHARRRSYVREEQAKVRRACQCQHLAGVQQPPPTPLLFFLSLTTATLRGETYKGGHTRKNSKSCFLLFSKLFSFFPQTFPVWLAAR